MTGLVDVMKISAERGNRSKVFQDLSYWEETRMFLQFANGIRAWSKVSKEANSFVCKLFILSGTAAEGIGSKDGLAHFTEHMVLRGPKSFDKDVTFSSYVEELGMGINAVTSKDFMCFEVQSESSICDKALALIIDMVFNPALREEDFLSEKMVVVEELNYSEDDPETICRSGVAELMWGPLHQLGRTTLGNRDSINSITIDDIRVFVENNFSSSNFFLSLAGNYDEQLICNYIDNIQCLERSIMGDSGDCIKYGNTNPGSDQRQIQFIERDSSIVYAGVGFKIYNWRKNTRWMYDLMNFFVGDGIGSRLFQAIRQQCGVVYNIWSKPSFYRAGGEYNFGYCTDKEHRELVNSKLTEELKKLSDIDEKGYRIVKTKFRSDLLFSLDNYHSYAYWVGRNFSIHHRVMDIQDVLEYVEMIDRYLFQQAVAEIFDRDPLCAVEVGPPVANGAYAEWRTFG